MKKWIGLLLLVSLPLQANEGTQVINFSEEELPTESVVPVFEKKIAVKNKTVPKKGRFELGLQLGSLLTEAFYDPYALSGSVHYHFNEFHAIEFSATSFIVSESQFVDILGEDVSDGDDVSNNIKGAPTLESLLLASWEFTPYYGKISLTKQNVFNIAIYSNFHVGTVNNGASTSLAYGFGLGQKLYFSPNWGLRVELRGLFFDMPNPLSPTYKEEQKFNLSLNVGLLTMLPFLQ